MNQLSSSEPNFFEIDANDPERAGSIEPLGTKRKFWMKVGDGSQSISYLVKLSRPNTGEDWAEYLVSKLAALLGLPHAKYELGTVTGKDGLREPAVRSERLYEQGDSLVHGNQLLVQIDPQYPANEARKYRLSAHTVEAVKAAVGGLEPPRPKYCQALPTGVTTAIDVYIGYLLLAAWVANQDRHHENWGAIELNGKLTLSPTYDHGSALGSLILDEERRSG